MSERFTGAGRLSRTAIVAVILVTAGVLLWMFVSRGLLIVAGLGAFGPGILRELGLLRDQDEFQRQAAHRAGYHAYLIGGFGALAVLTLVEWGGSGAVESSEWIRFVVVLLWLTWLSSTLLTYWGARKTAFRVLVTFGAFWAVFVVAMLIGDATVPGGQELTESLLGVAMGTVVVAPFFGLAWSARRWPRPTGMALMGVSLIFMVVFGRGGPGLSLATTVLTDTLLIGPLVVSGLALLLDWGSEALDEAAA